MTFEEQLEIIQAAIDGRTVTYTSSIFSDKLRHANEQHTFNFVENTYTIEPLYKKGEVIMVRAEPYARSNPSIFIEMRGNAVLCEGVDGDPETFSNHRKQTKAERGEE